MTKPVEVRWSRRVGMMREVFRAQEGLGRHRERTHARRIRDAGNTTSEKGGTETAQVENLRKRAASDLSLRLVSPLPGEWLHHQASQAVRTGCWVDAPVVALTLSRTALSPGVPSGCRAVGARRQWQRG